MPASVSEQEERRGGGGGSGGGPSRREQELELRCRMLEIDNRAEAFRCEEYRKLMIAHLGGGVHLPVAEPLRLGMPALLPLMPVEPERGAPEREWVGPAPAGGSSVRPVVAQPVADLRVLAPPVAAAPATPARATRRRTVLPSSAPPPSESSRLVGAAGRGRGRGRGGRRGRGRGRSRGASAGPVSSRTQRRPPVIDSEPSHDALAHIGESRAAAASAPPGPVGRGGAREGQRRGRRASTSIYSLSMGAIRRKFPFTLDSPSRGGSRRFCSRAAAELFLRENGVDPASSLSPQDNALADATPTVTLRQFSKLFGGNPTMERPRSLARNILCFHPKAQPYGPRSPGEPGLMFISPGVVRLEDNYPSFHVFINASPLNTPMGERKFQYLGAYSKVPMTRTTLETDDWLSLPIGCRAAWSWRISSSTQPEVRAIHARISMHNTRPHGPAPSPDEISDWLEQFPGRHQGISERTITSAFNSGEEKMDFAVLKCVKYDVEVAMKLRSVSPVAQTQPEPSSPFGQQTSE